MGGKSSTISTEEPRLGTLRVQTSMYGLCVPMVWGQARVTGNLLWFGNFQAIANTTVTSQGGKGGGGVTQIDTKYTYKASAVLALASGPVLGVISAWKGKRRYFGFNVPGAKTLLAQALSVPTGVSTMTAVVPAGDTFGATVSVSHLPSTSDYQGGGF